MAAGAAQQAIEGDQPAVRPGPWSAPPLRHGADLSRSREMAARLRMLLRGDPEPDADTWHALGMALWRGDPAADAVVQWAQAHGLARAWPVIERALAANPGSLATRTNDGFDWPAPLRAYVLQAHARPPWLDDARLRRGARVLQATGRHGMLVLRDAGLMAGYQASAINQTLVRTGALEQGAQRRVAETAQWWLACTADGGMAPGAPGFQLTLKVRLMHALVRARLQAQPDWDAAYLGLPINQLDMQATYLAFSTVQLLALRMTGEWLSRRDANGVMHLWRYIGWLMGVEDALLCDDEAVGRVLLYRNLLSQAPSDDTSVKLGRALMDEPLGRPYRWGRRWRGRFDRARHLSLVRWFVGRQGMRNLGLPPTLPWYPLLVWLPHAVGSVSRWLLPPLRPLARRWGRRQQLAHRELMHVPDPVSSLPGAAKGCPHSGNRSAA